MMLDDTTIAQLFETLIWQAMDNEGKESLDYYGYERDDIDPDQQEALVTQFRAFVETNDVDVRAYMSHTGRALDDVAHDYILTANHHGAGFWDRCYCGIDQSDAPAKRLTNMAHLDGPIDLFVQDGCIELML